ncbi:MAG: MBL fold metallo-hydrolase RNA specificity domain-containing protein [Fimbriimonas sp.]
MSQSIGFYGAAETVTGSRHILTVNGKRILVDCGLFQGSRELRERNWLPFPIAPHDIDAVVITHAHTDHIGWLPRLVSQGYRGPIYATPATIGLSRISLPDSARLQEEEARHRQKIGSRHNPPLPLYTEEQAYATIRQFEPVRYGQLTDLPGGAQFQYHPAGHILGSAFAEVFFESGERILMSGDLGRFDTPILHDPMIIEQADYLVVESTYGDRLHAEENPLEKIASVLEEAVRTGGAVIIPSFAIGRTQELLYYFRQLEDQGRLPRIPIYIDSPMAVSVTHVYAQAKDEHDAEMKIAIEEGRSSLEPRGVNLVRDREGSKALNRHPGPLVIISGSGMANGGRVTHHLLQRLNDPTTIVLFTGYQAEGTLGRRILEGEPTVRIHRQEVDVRAKIEKVNALSAHADQGEILRWLRGFKSPPRRTFLVHGEPPAQAALQEKIRAELGWEVVIPKHGETFGL